MCHTGARLGVRVLFAAAHFRKLLPPFSQSNYKVKHRHLIKTIGSEIPTFKFIFIAQVQMLQAYQTSTCKYSFRLKQSICIAVLFWHHHLLENTVKKKTQILTFNKDQNTVGFLKTAKTCLSKNQKRISCLLKKKIK